MRKINVFKKLKHIDVVKWIGLSIIIASPIAYYATDNWLQRFAYRTNISWWIFALAVLIVLFIAFLAVTYVALRTARKNPVECLRYE